MSNPLKNIVVVSCSTGGSRILGLLRDILIFAALGASLWNSAFIMALTLPNLFRRLLGEGALTSAMVPVFSDVLERDGRGGAFAFFNQVLLRLLLTLVLLITAGMVILGLLARSGILSERWALGSELAVVLLPYMLFICLAAILSAGLNLLGRFAVAAATPVLLNLSMIGALLAGFLFDANTEQLVYWLCGGVLLGGLLQFGAPLVDMMRQGWRPSFKWLRTDEMGQLWRLFIPGLMAAGILQVNILVSRLLAYTLDDSAVSVLYLASRLMELPLGVFTIAVATVFFPLLAKACSANDSSAFSESFLRGMRMILCISVPAGVGLWVLAEPILALLFEWGAYDRTDVMATIPLLAIYGVGLPFYSAATFATRGLHSWKDMKAPARIAGLCLLINAAAGFILMQFLGAGGLASANVIAAMFQAALLWRVLACKQADVGFSQVIGSVFKIFIAAVFMAIGCMIGQLLLGQFAVAAKLEALLAVAILIPVAVTVYFVCLWMLKFEELDGLADLLKRYLSKK